MIAFVQGKIIDSDATSLTILANSVGYRVFVPGTIAHSASQSPDMVSLYTYLHVKEAIMDLYGFESSKQRSIFELLVSVSGVGPRTALGILDAGTVEAISGAIVGQNEAFFTQVSGIGPRGAKKIIFELKNKMSDFDISITADTPAVSNDAAEALMGMGYNMSEISSTLSQLDTTLSAEETIKDALKLLDSHS